MSRGLVAVVLGACAFDPNPVVLPPEGRVVTLVEDTTADFASSGELVDAKVTAHGTIEPHAFVVGGLRAQAFVDNLVTPTSTWADIQTAVTAGVRLGSGYQQVPTNWMDVRPTGLAMRDSDDFTLIYEGEVRLHVGDNVLAVDADDTGFVEVDLGEGFAGTVIDTAPEGVQMVTLAAPRDGWYPIRAALGEDGGFARLVLALDGAPVAADQLRARVTDDRGLVVKTFERGHVPALGTTAVAVVDSTFGRNPPPYDLRMTSTYDLRFVGQIFIDTAGTWTLAAKRTSTVDLMRLWIDGKRVASGYEDAITDGLPEVATLELAVGWHDLAVDLAAYQQLGNDPNPHDVGIAFTATRPGGVELPVTTDMLRPVVAANLPSAFLSGVIALPADTVTEVPITVPAIPGAVIDLLDAGYFIDNANVADFTVELDTGAGTIPVPSADPGMVFQNTQFAGQPLPTTPWIMRFTDTVADGNPTSAFAFFVHVDFSCHGGAEMPFAQTMTYTSSPLATPGAVTIDAVRVRALLDDATATTSLRVAASEGELEAAPWITVDGQPIAASALVQYRITTASDGWKNPSIDAVELDYRVPE